MSASQDFKDDPLDFMNNNVVIVRYGMGATKLKDRANFVGHTIVGKAVTLTLTPYNNYTGYLHDMRIPVYKLELGHQAGVDDQIFAYWCPYSDDKTYGVVLKDVADYMFTAEMDGCSFGVGSRGRDGSRLVYHANVHGSDRQDQQDKQHSDLANVNASHMILHPTAYRTLGAGLGYRVTTFGLRLKNKWQFHYQVHEYQQQFSINLFGVTRLTAGRGD